MNKRIAQFLSIPFILVGAVLTAVLFIVGTLICCLAAIPGLIAAGLRRVFEKADA